MKRLILTAAIRYSDRTVVRAREAVPYEPGTYDFGYDYPFTKMSGRVCMRDIILVE